MKAPSQWILKYNKEKTIDNKFFSCVQTLTSLVIWGGGGGGVNIIRLDQGRGRVHGNVLEYKYEYMIIA